MFIISRNFFCLLAVVVMFVSCSKEESLITGNEAPEDPTVSTLVKENYVRKSHLNLLGRQPVDSELLAAYSILDKDNCSGQSRNLFIGQLLGSAEYRAQLYNIENADLLNGVSDSELEQEVTYFQNQLNDPSNADDYVIIREKLRKSILLQSLKEDMISGAVNLRTAHMIITDTPLYEGISGGDQEWVKAIFSHFLYREPTENELENCTEMMSNQPQTLFFTEGSSRDDLISIFFSSQEYNEGQVRKLYRNYLFREPGADEMAFLSGLYSQENNYPALQKGIMTNDEFMGLKN